MHKLSCETVHNNLKKVGCLWVDGEYHNCYSKLVVTCSECGCRFERSYDEVVNHCSNRCYVCSGTIKKNELKVINVLSELGISCKFKERPFEDMKYKDKLEIDIVAYDKKGKIALCIEINGEQHYKPVKAWGGKKGFKLTQIRDSIKYKYLHENEIPFVVIPYWAENDLENIVMNHPAIQKLISL